ncbi:MAG: O-antigen ligase family protein, partial [Acidimicrobiales bacterium]
LLVTGVLPDAVQAISGPRLTASSPDRAKETAAAVALVRDHPLTGTGPGNANLIWRAPGGEQFFARWAHNEYLQVTAELGLPGLLLFGLLIAAIARTVVTGRQAGVAAALVAIAVHSGFDFLLHVSAIPLLAAALTGLTIEPPEKEKA